jgi:hypothetical protein
MKEEALVSVKSKRRYTKRRKDLERNHICPLKECQSKFASMVALRNHYRAKHFNEPPL